jgi:hypothetical protein
VSSTKPRFRLDLNSLIALGDPDHQHHQAVHKWFQSSGKADWGGPHRGGLDPGDDESSRSTQFPHGCTGYCYPRRLCYGSRLSLLAHRRILGYSDGSFFCPSVWSSAGNRWLLAGACCERKRRACRVRQGHQASGRGGIQPKCTCP